MIPFMYLKAARARGVVFQEGDDSWSVAMEDGRYVGGFAYEAHADEELARLAS